MERSVSIAERIDGISELLSARLGVRKTNLGRMIGRAGRLLPRPVRQQARVLARAEPVLQHPKLMRTLDNVALRKAADMVEAHLTAIDAADRRKGKLLDLLGAVVFNLLLVAAGVLVVLVWRGLI